LDRPQRPFFCAGVGGVDEGFGEIDFAAIAEIGRQPFEEAIEPPTALPLLKATVTRLVRRVARREIGPGRAGPQDPQHTVEDGARVGPRAPASIGTAARTKRRLKHGPLGVGQIHTVGYDGDLTDVSGRDFRL
jgi:hypothetical protein